MMKNGMRVLMALFAMVLISEAAEMSQDTQPLVGTYYYPWYRDSGFFRKDNWKRQVMRSKLAVPQEPMLGWYDSRDADVIGAHVAQSVRGGIDFWSVSWWGKDSKTDRIFKDAVLEHPDSHKLKYAMLYESTGRFGKFKNPNYDKWIPDLEYLKKTYFDDPRYLKVDGRPVLFVYLTREYFRDKGHDALKEMRARFPEIYLVGDDVFFGVNDAGVTLD